MSEEFVFLDFETTGLDPAVARVIEVAAIKANVDGVELGHYHALVNPEVSVPQNITELTGIDTENIRANGIHPSLAIKELLEFIGDGVVVAFNADFDRSFLFAEAKLTGINIPPLTFVCALSVSRQAWPIFRRHSLRALAIFFGVRTNPSCFRRLSSWDKNFSQGYKLHMERKNLFPSQRGKSLHYRYRY